MPKIFRLELYCGNRIDYEGGKYVIYTQSLDFMNVAKQETKAAEPAPIWVGRATGYTLEMAINAIYNASPLPVLFEHTSALIITERAMKHNVNHMMDALRRYRKSGKRRGYSARRSPWTSCCRHECLQYIADHVFAPSSGGCL